MDNAYQTVVSIVDAILEPEQPIEPDALLADRGLDSIRMISLYFALEDELGVKFESSELTSENFSTVRQIANLVLHAISRRG